MPSLIRTHTKEELLQIESYKKDQEEKDRAEELKWEAEYEVRQAQEAAEKAKEKAKTAEKEAKEEKRKRHESINEDFLLAYLIILLIGGCATLFIGGIWSVIIESWGPIRTFAILTVISEIITFIVNIIKLSKD